MHLTCVGMLHQAAPYSVGRTLPHPYSAGEVPAVLRRHGGLGSAGAEPSKAAAHAGPVAHGTTAAQGRQRRRQHRPR